MAELNFEQGVTCIVMDEKDNVATLLMDVKQGEKALFSLDDKMHSIIMLEDVGFGHKTAIIPMNEGDSVVKYGEVIGTATFDIKPGEHVHIHNIEGIRGRGDKKKEVNPNEND